jgi:ankyrin repeat protein
MGSKAKREGMAARAAWRGGRMLRVAAGNGDLEAVDAILAQWPDAVGIAAPDGATALMAAAGAGSLPCVERLLPLSDPNARADFGDTALTATLMTRAKSDEMAQGQLDCLRRLLAVCDARAADTQGVSPLMIAVEEGRIEAARMLLPLSDPAWTDKGGRTALMLAANSSAAGADECVEILAGLGGAKRRRKDGVDALMMAANHGNARRLRALLPVSDASTRSEIGWTALMLAAWSGDPERVALLLPVSDLSALNDRMENALAAMIPGREDAPAAGRAECARLLALAGVDPLAKNKNGDSAWVLARKNQDWGCADVLSDFVPEPMARAALAIAGEKKMPKCAALVESRALRAEIAAAKPAAEASPESGAVAAPASRRI